MDYFIKTSIVVSLFYLCYVLFLKRETFFQHNRWFLLTGLGIALLFPLIIIPVEIPIAPKDYGYTMVSGNVLNTTVANDLVDTQFNWLILLPIIYLTGLCLCFIQFILQFGSLTILLLKNPKQKHGFYTYVIIKNKVSPFSFFKWIVFNPESYNQEELDLVLAHEKVHVNQLHSIDIIFTQLVCCVFWFNPILWLYKKDVKQNLEYIADYTTQRALKNEKHYQILLLKTTIANQNMPLTNNFYNSLIKKRIVMLQKSKSNSKKKWRYALMLPIILGLLLSMNTKEIYVEAEPIISDGAELVEAKSLHKNVNKSPQNVIINIESPLNIPETITEQNKQEAKKQQNATDKGSVATASKPAGKTPIMVAPKSVLEVIITKNTTERELKNIAEDLEGKGLTIRIKGVKRNSDGEITAIKIDAKSKKSNSNYSIKTDDGIAPIRIMYDLENNSISIGNKKSSNHDSLVYVYETEGSVNKIHGTNKANVFIHSDDIDIVHEQDPNGKVVIGSWTVDGNAKVVRGDKIRVITEGIITEDNKDIIIEKISKNEKLKIGGGQVFEVISEDDDNTFEIIIDDEGNKTIREKVIVDGNKIKIITKGEVSDIKGKVSKNIWIDVDDDEVEDIVVLKKSDKKNKIVFKGNKDKNPLVVLDGKTYTKFQIEDMDLGDVESINVFKGGEAIKKYGKKAKDGVIEIITKKD